MIPVLDFRKLKHVKAYNDWYGYVQKLETSVKLLREKIKKLEDERFQINAKYNKLHSQIRSKAISKTMDMSHKNITIDKSATLQYKREDQHFGRFGLKRQVE